MSFGFCIHGHFYQPPREDPLTGEIPVEMGANPYKNWNEKIHDQCYRPNALLGNFKRVSFNIGPTLVEWMAGYDAITLHQIIEQERMNFEQQGVGNGMAQAYNHTILPLASKQDKITQIRWGLGDYLHRFGHQPSGLWLPEAAVDEETLEVLVEQGMEFVILAPWQAHEPHLDTTQPYLVKLTNGKEITAFFYDRDLSTRISFDPPSTVNADEFIVKFLLPKYRKEGGKTEPQPQLIMAASDGELYGHHQHFRDKFLSHLMSGALKNHPVEPTYPALWLKKHPAKKYIHLRYPTSWSCHHGVTRWMGSCGCTDHPAWKAPLRQAFNEIAYVLDEHYEHTMGEYFSDPWEVRHQFIQVLLRQVKLEEWVQELSKRSLKSEDIRKISLLLSAQFERQRIFTSCGWFFEDFDRIEPRNNVAYSAQAVWLTYLATGVDLTSKAMGWLRQVKSWRTGLRGDVVFSQYLQRLRSGEQQLYPRLGLALSASPDNNLLT